MAHVVRQLPAHIIEAQENGLHTAGRGPWYCTRILPDHLPVRRQDLLASGTTRWVVDRDWTQVADGMMVENTCLPGLADARDLGAFPACMVTRVRGLHQLHPTFIVSGWAAAPFHGLLYWADSAAVLLLAEGRSNGSDRTETAKGSPLSPAIRPLPPGFDLERDTIAPDPLCPQMRVVTAPVALAQCLRSVLSGKHGWPVVEVDGLTDRQVRAVQLIDAFAQCSTVTWNQLEDAATGLISRRQLRRLSRLVAAGAESPRETELRLMVRDLLPAGHRWETQVEVSYGEERSWRGTRDRTTFFDIGCRSLRIGLYYDGKHHDEEGQVEKDFEQLQDLTDGEWIVVRVNRTLMKNRPKLMRQLHNAIARAVAARQAAAAAQTAAQASK